MKWIGLSGIIILILLAIISRITVPVHLFTKQFAKADNVDNQLPKVLLIGDSTTIRYFPLVRDALRGKAIVYRLARFSHRQKNIIKILQKQSVCLDIKWFSFSQSHKTRFIATSIYV